ncbi:S8 family serine peptidase, partial [Armatimonas sp.]|uniref:S8 family serine peptidase n=1 Tax=Armatimonas sp. TaxID=1872638 RepID=UPI003751C7BC
MYKEDNQFIVRTDAQELERVGLHDALLLGPGISRVVTQPERFEAEMARARPLAPTHHAYREAESDQEFLITDRVYLRFKMPLGDAELAGFLGQYGLILSERYSDTEIVAQLTDATGMNPNKLVVELTEKRVDLIDIAENDLVYRVSLTALALPRDGSYPNQWHLHGRSASTDVDPRSSSRCEAAWLLLDSMGSADVIVAVTDDGCRLDHQDFNGPSKFAGWAYSVYSAPTPPQNPRYRLTRHTDPGADPARMYEPGRNHGTCCAGVIAAEADGLATVGAAPGCRLFPIKWISSLDGGLLFDDSHFREVLDYLADRVDIISNSWGNSPTMSFGTQVLSRIRELARTGGRRGKGILFVFAAGNENCPLQHSGTVNVPYTSGWDPQGRWVGVETSRVFNHPLTAIPGVFHVAALASNARRSHYSCYGTGVDLCAPT